MHTTSKAIAQRVDAVRRAKGVGTLPLSVATGIPRTTLSRQLKGETDFTVAGLIRIGEALNTPAATWLRDLPGVAA